MITDAIFIGDSLTLGYGVPKKQCWVTMLSSKLNIPIKNKGVNGDTTPSMLNRFYEDVILNSPSFVFIMGGTNDLLCGRSVSSILENIEEMITDCLSNNINILLGIPPLIIKEMAENLFIPSPFYDYCSTTLPILRNSLICLCKKFSIPYIDFYDLTLKNVYKCIYIDGIHLNFLGNTLMLEEAFRIINRSIF